MSNTSYQFKENNQEMIQGGEKKVMKKILSVALSTAMAFSMFASVAFGDAALTSQQKFDVLKEAKIMTGYADGSAGLDKDMNRAEFAKVVANLMGLEPIKGQVSFKDKGYTESYWATPYIEAVYAAGLMQGKNETKKIFDYKGKVTVQEMAAVLVRALKLEVPANPNNNASDWAKGYVQAAIDAKIIEPSVNAKANATRAQLVDTAYEIHIQQQKPKVVSYEVKESGKVVEFKLANNELVKVELETALKANTATDVKFTHNNYEYTHNVTWVVTSATKVESATSTNLKEVDVVFDGKVEKASATDKNNYVIDSNSKGIKSITVLEDGKTARILLNESSKFVQGTTYKIVVKNVKGEQGATIPQGEVSFSSSDNTLPTVTEVKALGTKVIKVTFSEPVIAPSSSNFQLDDKMFSGTVTQGPNQREVILKDYTGGISVGAHKLTTSLVEDYAGLKSLADTKDFTVAVDTEGPKVTEISATLEKVTITFDEEIDPASVTEDSFYWKSGDSKKKGKATQIAANVYEVDFTSNRLPGYETNLFVEVKDYSGNVNPVKEHKVTASIDLVQPRVLETTFGVDRKDTLTVRFDKAVDAADKKYFTVKKGSDVIPVNTVVAADASNKIFYVSFFSKLEGTYDLKVKDVKDRTALQNTMVEYDGTFVAADNANLTQFSNYDWNDSTRKLSLHFGKEMDITTTQNKANYYIEFQKNGGDVQQIALPSEVVPSAVNGGKSVVLQFPEFINGTRVTFGENGTVKKVLASGLKSKTGQNVAWINETLQAAKNQLTWTGAKQKDAKTFELEFTNVIAHASSSDFTVNGSYPSEVKVDGNKVTLKTSDEHTGATITLFANNSIETYSNNKLNLSGNAVMTVKNVVAPKLTGVTNRVGASFTVTFSTYVDSVSEVADLKNDFILRDLSKTNNPIIPVTDYKTSYANDGKGSVVITLTDAKLLQDNPPISVKVRKDAQYIVAQGSTTKALESDEFNVAAPAAPAVEPVSVTDTTYNEATSTLTVKVGKTLNNIVNGKVSIATNKGTTYYNAELAADGNSFTVVVPKEATINGGELTASVVLKENGITVDLKGTIKY
ncbi:S-layer homology domain-containing protein [Paenibacillus uliginis N3/975]|uniref:S-layer homology domain-containing protein n=1 Tax=Paenibacillus uliginis N3/975 TaxID=1313296 RepID=A0A1X7GB73_9BACL|nr:S-layer homology domain-containing protein [Paenibacillus uliginis]SMF67076.1 S-layer homology domain-containing protein [Paenibacillus uliginis N3/975]